MQLKPCGDNYNDAKGRDLQVLIGFDEIGKFELHHNGQDKTNPGNLKCMTNREFSFNVCSFDCFNTLPDVKRFFKNQNTIPSPTRSLVGRIRRVIGLCSTQKILA
jgi:hypothetical protein